MRTLAIAAALLALAAVPAPAAGMMQRIVLYECNQANRDGLLFKCEIYPYEAGSTVLVFKYSAKPDDRSQYRQDVLVKRFFDAGGMHVRLVDLAAKRHKRCGRPADRRYFLTCHEWIAGDWKPAD